MRAKSPFPSIVYNLNLPCIFDQFGFQRCAVHLNVPTVTGSYVSRFSLVVSYGLPSLVLVGYFPVSLSSLMSTHSSLNPPLKPPSISFPPHLATIQRFVTLPSSIVSPLTSPLVTINLAQLMAVSQSAACNAQLSVLEGCCSNNVSCNDLFVHHHIEPHHKSHEEQRDAVLHCLLNGLCASHPSVPSCKCFTRRLTSTMHLSYDICTLLLSAYKRKQVTLSMFRLHCASIGLRTNRGCDLFHKLQQRLT